MSKPKKLDLSVSELVDIAKAINENTIANKNRAKEEKINTDIFIKKFGINRKDFSETIKDSDIKYNSSTFLYDIPHQYNGNTKVIPKGNDKVIPKENKENQQVFQGNDKVIPKESNTEIAIRKEVLQAVKSAIDMEYPELKEMIEHYKSSREQKDIIDVPEIRLDNKKLDGEIVSKSFKSYEPVFNEFVEFCKKRKETQKDLMALALIEFMEKYKWGVLYGEVFFRYCRG